MKTWDDLAITSQRIAGEVFAERTAQVLKWGEQHHLDGTGPLARLLGYAFSDLATIMRKMCDKAHQEGEGTWAHILLEETFEAMAEEEWPKLRTELVQCAAVIAAWIEDGDGRHG